VKVKTHRESPAPRPMKPRHQRETSSASSRKPYVNYTTSEDESVSSREPPKVREIVRQPARKSPARPPTDPVPITRRDIEQRYKRGFSVYNLLSSELQSQRSLNELALDGDEHAENDILSEGELVELVKLHNEWHNELLKLRTAFERLDGNP